MKVLQLMLLLLGCMHATLAQLPRAQTSKPEVMKRDIPLIRCQACEATAKHILKSVKTMREALKSGQKLPEADILERLEKMCDPEVEEGDWISMYDIIEEGDKLKLVDVGLESECNSECRTIARVCNDLLEELDITEMSSKLYSGMITRSQLSNWMCYDQTNACLKKPGPAPKDRVAGPMHKPLTADEKQKRDMLRTMKASGMKGQIYDRNNMMEEMAALKEQYEYDEDEDAGAPASSEKRTSAAGGEQAEPSFMDDVKRITTEAMEGAKSLFRQANTFLKKTWQSVVVKSRGKSEL